MEHYVFDNLCNHSKEMPLYDIASCLLGESLIGIDSLVARFHKHFYSTHRSVGVTELTEAKQRQHESVDDFIAIWINLELSCEQEFFEAQQLKMCINCFRYELSHILASQTIQTFEELCSKAHDLEAQILRKKGKKEEGKAGTSATIAMVETNKANKAPVLLIAQAKEKGKGNVKTLKKQKEKEYSFRNEDVEDFFTSLLEQGLIELPEPKRPDEVGRVGDPKY